MKGKAEGTEAEGRRACPASCRGVALKAQPEAAGEEGRRKKGKESTPKERGFKN